MLFLEKWNFDSSDPFTYDDNSPYPISRIITLCYRFSPVFLNSHCRIYSSGRGGVASV